MTIKLYFHLGAHRTAISAIKMRAKAICKRKYTEDNKLMYIGGDIFKTPFGYLASWKHNNSDEIKLLQEFIENQNKHNGINKFFICHENLCGKMLGLEKGIYPNVSQFIKNIKKLKNVKISCSMFVRKQDSFVESAYKFRVRNEYRKSLDGYLDDINPESLSWTQIAREFSDNGVDLKLYPYDFLNKDGYQSNLHSIFKDALPNTRDDDFTLTKENASFNDFTYVLLKNSEENLQKQSPAKISINEQSIKLIPKKVEQLNDSQDFKEVNEKLTDSIREIYEENGISYKDISRNVEISLKELLKNYNNNYEPFSLSKEQRSKILKFYEKDNQRLFNKYITDNFGIVWHETGSYEKGKKWPFSLMDILRGKKAA